PADGAGNDVIVDFHTKQAEAGGGAQRAADQDAGVADVIDLRPFQTSFRALDNNHDGILEQGESDGHITIQVDGNDTVLAFAEGSVRIGSRGTSAGDRGRSGGRVLGQAQHSGELAPLAQAEDPMRVASTKRSVESSMRRPALPRGA